MEGRFDLDADGRVIDVFVSETYPSADLLQAKVVIGTE